MLWPGLAVSQAKERTVHILTQSAFYCSNLQFVDASVNKHSKNTRNSLMSPKLFLGQLLAIFRHPSIRTSSTNQPARDDTWGDDILVGNACE